MEHVTSKIDEVILIPESIEVTPTGYLARVSAKELERVLAANPPKRIQVKGIPVRFSTYLLREVMCES